MVARIETIYLATAGGQAMRQVECAEALVGLGFAGDRYADRTGYWTNVDECQATLIEGEALDRIATEWNLRVSNGEHRRNMVTRGISLLSLTGARFRIGEAMFEFDRPRPPCRYVETLTEPGMTRALARAGGGICARVISGGVLRAGDSIELVP